MGCTSVNKEHVYVLIETELGDIKVKLYNETPLHRDNFVKLVKEGYYNDLLFHRVIKDFMIQGGDPDSKGAAADKTLWSSAHRCICLFLLWSKHYRSFIHQNFMSLCNKCIL